MNKQIKRIIRYTTSLIVLTLLATVISKAIANDTPPPLIALPGTNIDDALITPKYVVINSTDQVTFSSQITANVENIYVKEGSAFKKNDSLLLLDCSVQQAELNKSLAQLEEADTAKKSAEQLEKYNAISKFELVKAKTDAEEAAADVAKLQSIIDKCLIKAPFNGAVAAIMAHRFETVKPGDPLLRIVNTESLEVSIQIPSSWLEWLHTGVKFKIHIHELNKDVEATIVRVNPQIEAVSQTVKIIATIDQNNHDLLPGMSGEAEFPDNPNLPKKHEKH